MCELCSTDPTVREQERRALITLADDCELLADEVMNLYYGVTKPHSEEAAKVRIVASRVIKQLCEHWL